ncbi:MAG: hypothetical protein QM724_11100 [Flavobacteriales bacterium]
MAKKKRLPKIVTHRLNWLEWVAIALSAWFLLYPKPYVPLFCILLVLPVAGLLISGIQNPSMAALVTLKKNDKDGAKYDVADFIDFPAWVDPPPGDVRFRVRQCAHPDLPGPARDAHHNGRSSSSRTATSAN